MILGYLSNLSVSNDWKIVSKKFQRLEKSDHFFPMIGKNHPKVSNDWKMTLFFFQRLEKSSRNLPMIGKRLATPLTSTLDARVRFLDLFDQLLLQLGILFQRAGRRIATLSNLVPFVRKPGAAFLDQVVLYGGVND